jgi:hypothetical protein
MVRSSYRVSMKSTDWVESYWYIYKGLLPHVSMLGSSFAWPAAVTQVASVRVDYCFTDRTVGKEMISYSRQNQEQFAF